MNGKKIISRLKRLSDVETIKDVEQLTHTLFPGSHCPLMGAALVAKGIENSMVMVIGTDECAYYTKTLTINKDFGGIRGRCVSVVIDNHDVTFGSAETTERAFDEMIKEYSPTCVFLVTTCVIEIIGDDFDSIADQLTEKYNLPVMAVHTEHFKCADHIPGIERTITACFSMMEDAPKSNCVNILGQRLGRFDGTELHTELVNAGVEIGLMLPSGCTIDDIKVASGAKVNVVVNETALPLAKLMEEKFGVPYVSFERYGSLELTLNSYKTLFNHLEMELPANTLAKYEEAKEALQVAKADLDGVTYIYGNTPFSIFEVNAFMVSIGMQPLLIQASKFNERDVIWQKEILETVDPLITKSANITPLQYVYDELQPNLYLGHEYAGRLKDKNIALVTLDQANSLLGFETALFLVNNLVACAKLAEQYRNGDKSAMMPPMMMAMMSGGAKPKMPHGKMPHGAMPPHGKMNAHKEEKTHGTM
ncbi:MAG: hypothetical protein ATN36_00035 [Epulopiscium sp. Nele67-Bin005]|nr:MAG: hypothetical protein ATN36_00035 [Epulopiscium sp. Nele67-Bin005]